MCAASLAMTQWRTGINDLNGGESLMSSPQTAYKSRLLRWIEAYHWSALGVKLCILIRYWVQNHTHNAAKAFCAHKKRSQPISFLGKRILTVKLAWLVHKNTSYKRRFWMIWPLLTLTWTSWRWQVSRSSLVTDSPVFICAVPTDYWGRNLCCRDIWRMISRTTLRGAQTSQLGIAWGTTWEVAHCCATFLCFLAGEI